MTWRTAILNALKDFLDKNGVAPHRIEVPLSQEGFQKLWKEETGEEPELTVEQEVVISGVKLSFDWPVFALSYIPGNRQPDIRQTFERP